MNSGWRRSLARAAALICLSQQATPGEAQEPFYAGKTLKIVVGFPPGGGYDIYARSIARFPAPCVHTRVPSISKRAIFIRRAPARRQESAG